MTYRAFEAEARGCQLADEQAAIVAEGLAGAGRQDAGPAPAAACYSIITLLTSALGPIGSVIKLRYMQGRPSSERTLW